MIQTLARSILLVAVISLAGCATESSRSIQVEKVQSAAAPYTGLRLPVSVGKFDNRSNFMRGVFSDGVDRLGSQAKTTLVAHLQQSQRFSVLDRDNMAETSQEAKLQGTAQTLRGAAFVVTGDISEFGRKEVGDQQLFGFYAKLFRVTNIKCVLGVNKRAHAATLLRFSNDVQRQTATPVLPLAVGPIKKIAIGSINYCL